MKNKDILVKCPSPSWELLLSWPSFCVLTLQMSALLFCFSYYSLSFPISSHFSFPQVSHTWWNSSSSCEWKFYFSEQAGWANKASFLWSSETWGPRINTGRWLSPCQYQQFRTFLRSSLHPFSDCIRTLQFRSIEERMFWRWSNICSIVIWMMYIRYKRWNTSLPA